MNWFDMILIRLAREPARFYRKPSSAVVCFSSSFRNSSAANQAALKSVDATAKASIEAAESASLPVHAILGSW
jgi:hypothetical protein